MNSSGSIDITRDPDNFYVRVSNWNTPSLNPISELPNYGELLKDEDDCDKGKTLADTFRNSNLDWQDNWLATNTPQYENYYRTIGDELGISDERDARAIGDYFLTPYLSSDRSTDPMPGLPEPEDP